MWAEQRELCADLGLKPWEARKLTFPEVEELLDGDRRRRNRDGQALSWLMYWLPDFVAHGVLMGIGAAFNENAELPRIPKWEEFRRMHPDSPKEPE